MPALVIEVIDDRQITLSDGSKIRQQVLNLKKSDGQIVESLSESPLEGIGSGQIYKAGERVMIEEDEEMIYVQGHQVDWVSYFIFACFLLLVIVVGRTKGLFALLSLAIKGSLLFFLVIPAIKTGASPLLVFSLFCVAATFLTIALVSGLNRKSLAACLGTIFGVVLAGLFGAWVVALAKLSGTMEPEFQSIYYQFPGIKLTELIPAGVLVGALGATMDVAISIASALQEVHEAAPEKTLSELFEIGMNIGRDILGTMINTLILAYIGSSLATIILMSEFDPFLLLNSEIVIKEIIFSLVGSIGLITAIPFTALTSAYLYKNATK